MKKYKPVCVEWIDSSNCVTQGWCHEDDLPTEEPLRVKSTGFLYKKTKRSVRIVASYYRQPSGWIVDGVQDIPVVAIKKLRYLK